MANGRRHPGRRRLQPRRAPAPRRQHHQTARPASSCPLPPLPPLHLDLADSADLLLALALIELWKSDVRGVLALIATLVCLGCLRTECEQWLRRYAPPVPEGET